MLVGEEWENMMGGEGRSEIVEGFGCIYLAYLVNNKIPRGLRPSDSLVGYLERSDLETVPSYGDMGKDYKSIKATIRYQFHQQKSSIQTIDKKKTDDQLNGFHFKSSTIGLRTRKHIQKLSPNFNPCQNSFCWRCCMAKLRAATIVGNQVVIALRVLDLARSSEGLDTAHDSRWGRKTLKGN